MGTRESIEKVRKGIIDLNLENIAGLVSDAIRSGLSAREVIEQGMREGMSEVGRRFEAGEYYLAELVLAGETMKAGLSALESEMPEEIIEPKGTVVLATVRGDVHDIGKNLVCSTLSAAGYRIVDLGVDKTFMISLSRVLICVRYKSRTSAQSSRHVCTRSMI